MQGRKFSRALIKWPLYREIIIHTHGLIGCLSRVCNTCLVILVAASRKVRNKYIYQHDTL